MNGLAEQVESRLDIKDVLEYYGIQFNSRGFARCPFHDEKTASLSIKNGHYKCFGCSAYGGSIDFVMNYYGLKFMPAVSKLSADFSLGLLDEKPTLRQAQAESKRIKEIQAERAKRAAEREEYLKELAFYQQLRKAAEIYAPESEQDGFHPVFVYALHHLGYLERWLDSNMDRLGAGGGRI